VISQYYSDKSTKWLRSALNAINEGRFPSGRSHKGTIEIILKRKVPLGCIEVWDDKRWTRKI
jgi:hypothetical protein